MPQGDALGYAPVPCRSRRAVAPVLLAVLTVVAYAADFVALGFLGSEAKSDACMAVQLGFIIGVPISIAVALLLAARTVKRGTGAWRQLVVTLCLAVLLLLMWATHFGAYRGVIRDIRAVENAVKAQGGG